MRNFWTINTHGDPIKTILQSIRLIWDQADIQMMLVPPNGRADTIYKPCVLKEPSDLLKINPFKPLMTINITKWIPETLKKHPGQTIGALLRPCEMRTLVGMSKLNGFSLENLITISCDCLGTLPKDDFLWQAARKGSSKELSCETLQFARQGGILNYRNRSACQICKSPQAYIADFNFHIIGLPVRQYLLVSARIRLDGREIRVNDIMEKKADSSQTEQHQKVAFRISQRNQLVLEKIVKGVKDILPTDIDSLVTRFESCGKCQACMDACPICDIHRPLKDASGNLDRDSVIRWLTACSGCGICEPACPVHLPLNIIFQYIQTEMDKETILM